MDDWDVGKSVRSSAWDSVEDLVRYSVAGSVRYSAEDSVWDSVRNSVRYSVWESARANKD